MKSNFLKSIFNKIKTVRGQLYSNWFFGRYKHRSAEEVFKDIYEKNIWGSTSSRSGSGAELHQTQTVINSLPEIIQTFKIKTLVDLPCGDWNWMRHVNLQGVDYHGGDIVENIIQRNQNQFASEKVNFTQINILKSEIPRGDLVLCRDCLVHFSYSDIIKALQNLRNSGSSYLLTTTFTQKQNVDIVTGAWRPINLKDPPFNFPKPILLINENCTEGGTQYHDKSLALWDFKNLGMVIDRMRLSLA